jgi:hypothetical protein
MSKKHSYKELEAYYARFGRKWFVRNHSDDIEYSFDSLLDMLKSFPQLKNVPAIELNYKFYLMRMEQKKNRSKIHHVVKTDEPVGTWLKHEKINAEAVVVTCYYCTGSGKAGFMKCPNCKGAGSIRVTSKGF